MAQGLVREMGVHSNGQGPRSHGRQHRRDPFRPVRGEQGHGVPGPESGGDQLLSQLPHRPGQLSIAPRLASLSREGDEGRPLTERGEAVDHIVEGHRR